MHLSYDSSPAKQTNTALGAKTNTYVMEHDSSDSSADWAQTFEISDLADSPAQSMKPSSDSVSASSAASSTSASREGDNSASLKETIIMSAQTILAIQDDDDEISADSQSVSDQHLSLSSVAEAARDEDVTSQMAAVDESDWVHVDPYSDDLQGMIHPTSRMFRAPGK